MLFDNLERFPMVSVFATKPSTKKNFFRSTAYFASASHSAKMVSAIGVIFCSKNRVLSLLRAVLLASSYCNPSRHPCQRDTLFLRWSLWYNFPAVAALRLLTTQAIVRPVRRTKTWRIHLLFIDLKKCYPWSISISLIFSSLTGWADAVSYR